MSSLKRYVNLTDCTLFITEKTASVMKADYDMPLPQSLLITIKKICRGLRVLEHVTAFNEGNQKHIIAHQGISVYRVVI